MDALKIRNLTKTYDNDVQALKGIDLTVKEGDFFALLGPNGAGKSTTIGIITSLVNKTSGLVNVYDADIDSDWVKVKSYIGLVPQELNFNQFETPYDIVINQAGFYGIPREVAMQRAKKYLSQLYLWDKRKVVSRTLSGGMKRRLMIARALMHEPKILILDEPTAGVDIEIRRETWEFLENLNREGTTIILTTHYLEEAERLCEGIAIIDKGEIVENTTVKELIKHLNMETFLLDLEQEITELPKINNYNVRIKDSTTLEADIPREQSMNDLFAALSKQGIHVISMRNKTNRLEELFLRLVKGENGSQVKPILEEGEMAQCAE